MIIENMSREEMIEFIKSYTVKVIKDIPDTNFKAGQYYQFYVNWDGWEIIDDEGKSFNLYELSDIEEYLEVK